MCWSAEVSLNTFIFSLFGTVFALANGTITVPEALFVITFASMQLVEYFAWSNLKNTETASKFGLALVLLEPLVSINAWYTGPYKTQILVGYVVAVVLMLATQSLPFTIHPASNGHLIWDWWERVPKLFGIVWTLVFFLGLYYAGPFKFGLAVSLLLVSVYNFYTFRTHSSMWCWFANSVALFLIGQVFYKNLCH